MPDSARMKTPRAIRTTGTAYSPAELRDRCNAEQVACFFKQWGGRRPKTGGRELDGCAWDEMPVARSRALVA